MADKKVRATATVLLELEVPCQSTWGTDCAIDQVHKQARDEAIGIIRNHLAKAGIMAESATAKVTVTLREVC